MKRHSLLLLALLAVLLVGRGNAQTPDAPSFTTTLPFEPMAQHGCPVVKVRLNGTVQARFLLDTGAPLSAINRDLVEKMGLPYENVPSKFRVVTLKGIEVGRLKRYGYFKVLEGNLLTNFREKKIDGIIGLNVLEGCAVFLNFDRQELTLTYPGNVSKEAVEGFGYRTSEATPIDLTWDKAKSLFYVPVTREGKTASLLLDTGSTVTILPKSFRKGVRGKPVYERELLVQDGIRKEPVYLIKGVSVGGAVGGEQAVVVSNEEGDYSRILGIDFLAQFNVLLDLPAKRLYLQRAGGENPSLQSNRQTDVEGMIVGVEDGNWKVISLDPRSRYFRSGVRPNDLIEAINDAPTKGMLTAHVIAQSRRLTTPTLRITRTVGGEKQQKTILVSAFN